MTIKELDSNYKMATISLDYDEIRCLTNCLLYLTRYNGSNKENNFNTVYADFIMLFSLVEHGMIPSGFELEQIYKLTHDEEKVVQNDKR